MNRSDRHVNRSDRHASADRAVTPAVGKTLELGLGVLVIAVLTTTLYGQVVPDYRTAAGTEVADRALADAARTVETAIPPAGVTVDATARTRLPTTIRGATYGLRADGRTLVLTHPHPRLRTRTALALPARVVQVTGTWRSSDPLVVRVTGNTTAVHVTVGGGT